MISRLLDICIGAMLVALVALTAQLAYLYIQPAELQAEQLAQRTSSHPVVNGQVIDEMPAAECMVCHGGHLP